MSMGSDEHGRGNGSRADATTFPRTTSPSLYC